MKVVDDIRLPFSWDQIEVVYKDATALSAPLVRDVYDPILVVAKVPLKSVDFPFPK